MVPIIEISPIVSGFMLTQTWVPLLTYSWKNIFSPSKNTAYGPHNNSKGITIVTNCFSSFTLKLISFAD